MKKRAIVLFSAILLSSACIQTYKTEQRVVELPKDDPRTSLATCESIVRGLMTGGFTARIKEHFPEMAEPQLRGIFITWNIGQFNSGKSIFILTGIRYQGEFKEAKEIADFMKDEAQKAVESYF